MKKLGLFLVGLLIASSVFGGAMDGIAAQYYSSNGTTISFKRKIGTALYLVEVSGASVKQFRYDLSQADKLNGITFRGSLRLAGDAYRQQRIDKPGQPWSEWQSYSQKVGLLELAPNTLGLGKINVTVKNGSTEVKTDLERLR